ncbi:hypothetical protein L208DRAFT_1373583 [Tricholoma matsutake]|nr:hypothetical protein L208DRAFT_1373583 [Tricholoma matsutake 945]
MPKHCTEDIAVEDVIDCINLNRGIVDGLLDLTRDELAAVLGHIANKGDIPTATFKMARSALPSFLTVKWADFASQYGLPTNPEKVQFTPYSTPLYCLPPSFQKTMFQNACNWQDVYCETVYQTQEQARLRVLEPYIVPLIALFHGQVINKPEQAMTETLYSTGGKVEHKIFMVGGVFFFIIEFKLVLPDPNALDQLFLALLSATKENMTMEFARLHVYGLLTNTIMFSFYSYDPITGKFCFDETILIVNKRPSSLAEMVNVSNKIFGLILLAYMDGLCTTLEKSRDRAKNNDVSSSIVHFVYLQVNPQFLLIGSLPEEMRKGSSGQEVNCFN